MEDNFDCATSIFSPTLFSLSTWLFAIIIIFRRLSREEIPRATSRVFPLAYELRDLDRHREWIMRKMDGKSARRRVESSQAILPSIMTTEIARNRKTNRVDYRRDSTALRISVCVGVFSCSSCALYMDNAMMLCAFYSVYRLLQ